MKFRLDEKQLPLIATFLVCAALYALAAFSYPSFFSGQVFADLFSENAPLGIAAIGMTFVILSGGIDLSVASVMALSAMVVAVCAEKLHLHPLVGMLIALGIGTGLGWATGAVIQFFDLPPFLVTLATLFLARGVCFLLSLQSIALRHPFFESFSGWGIPLGDVTLRARGFLFLGLVIAGMFLARATRFGRNVYAMGGNEYASKLMGLPVGRTKVLVYTLSGFCAALAGVTSIAMIPSGDPRVHMGLELDAIAAVVIGGTLLTGGVGYVAGTLLGVLILGIIQDIINFDGRLDTSWTRIATGLLLFAFIALQKLLTRLRLRPRKPAPSLPVAPATVPQ